VATYKCNQSTALKAIFSSEGTLGLSVKQTLPGKTGTATGMALFKKKDGLALPLIAAQLTLG